MEQAQSRHAERIARIVADPLAGLGYELVRVQLSGGRSPVVQIMVERSDRMAMTVDDCASVSRTLSAVLDVEDPIPGAYTLEVSSPGIDRPLTRLADFERFAGHLARIETQQPVEGRKRFKGTLLGVDGETVRLAMADAPADPPPPGATVALPYGEIVRAKLVLTDALIAEAEAEAGRERA